MPSKTKKNKKHRKHKKNKTRKKAILHPSHFIIPLKNAFSGGIIAVKLIGKPIVAMGMNVIKTLGTKVPLDILDNAKLLVIDTIKGTDRLSNKLRKTKKKGGNRYRKRRRRRRKRYSRKRKRT